MVANKAKSKKVYKRYRVYRVYHCCDFENRLGGHEECIGETYAVSEKKAINNCRYRDSTKAFPNGGYAFYTEDVGHDEALQVSYRAELV